MKLRGILVALIVVLANAAAFGAPVKIFVSPDSKPCVLHGVSVLESKLKAIGIETERAGAPQKGVQGIVIVDASDKNGPGEGGLDIPAKAESYVVKKGGGLLVGAGRDSVGAMYAAYDIAEQMEMAGKGATVDSVKDKVRTPSMELRAVNPFFHVDAFVDPKSWYYDEEYWKTYLDELSWDRYNLLDIHAMYELISTFFPNCYLYLLKSDKFPNVGISEEQAEINLKMFNKIIDLADERGIRVSLMSYHASWRKTDKDPEAIEPNDKDLADYTAEMVTKLIDKCPKLWMVGFRIGESGRNDMFFKDSYIRGIKEANRQVNMFTRSWLTTPVQVKSIASGYPGRTYVEIKYNGEQLGLPYHAMTTRRIDTASSYTFEDYTNWPRDYKIIWQIRANGTHRLFRWGDPTFASRVMKSVQFGSASGFSMEPMTSYYPPTDFFFKPEMKFDFFKWDHQRNWFWYMVWGRNAYDPSESKEVWMNRFRQHYGDAAAEDVYEMLTQMSGIVPLIYSWRCLGPDHRNMAPEYETGGSLDAFEDNIPLDPEAIYSIDEYAMSFLFNDQFLGAKMNPFEAADMLDKYADNARAAATRASSKVDAGNVEFKSLLAEFDTLEHLARYYSAKIRAATYLNFYKKKRTYPELKLAEKYSKESIYQWEELSNKGSEYFGQILDTLRLRGQVKKPTFTWGELRPQLDEDIKIIEDADKKMASLEKKSGKAPAVYHIPVFTSRQGVPLKLSATVLETGGADAEVALYYRAVGSKDFKKVNMSKDPAGGPAYVGEVPASDAHGKIEYYIEAAVGGNKGQYPSAKSAASVKNRSFTAEEYAFGTANRISSALKKLAAFEKRDFVENVFTDDFSAPKVTKVDVNVKPGGESASITIHIEDVSPISKAVIHYKPIPSLYRWAQTDMTPGSDGKSFTVDMQLTPEGILYYFNVADEVNNSTAYPDFREQTPYLLIDAWDPAINPYAK